MKRFVLLSALFMASVMPLVATAQETVTPYVKVYIKDFAIKPGEFKEVPIYIDNNIDLRDCQVQFFLPKGLHATKVQSGKKTVDVRVEGDAKEDGYSASSAVVQMEDGTERFRIVAIIMATGFEANILYKNYEGPLFTFGVTADSTYDGKSTIKMLGYDTPHWPLMFTYSTGPEGKDVGAVVSAPSDSYVYAAKPLAWFASEDAVAGEYAIEEAVATTATFGKEYYVSSADNKYMKLVTPAAASGISAKEEMTVPANIAAESIMGKFTIDDNGNPTMELASAPEASESTVATTTRTFNLAEHFAPEVNEVVKFEGYYRAADNRICAYSNFGGDQGQCITAEFNADATAPTDQSPISVTAAMQLKNPWASAGTALGDNGVTSMESLGAWKNYTAKVVEYNTNFTTAVNDILNKEVAGVKYVNVAGIESATPFEGVNIVVTTYTDGTTATTKIVK